MDRNDFEELTRRVLAQTSGSPCPSAHERLASLADDELAPGDAELMRMHLTHCRECARLLEVIGWLSAELPALAEVEPGPAFTRDVMAATAQRHGWRWAWEGIIDQARDATRALLARPRLPLEAAYVGAMLVWLLVAAPLSPLRGMPDQAAQLTRFNPGAVAQAAVVPIPRFLSNPVDTARALWSATTERLPGDEGRPVEQTWSVRLDRAADRARSLGYNGLRMAGETLRGNFSEGGNHLRRMGDDAKAIWNILGAPSPAPEPSRTRPTTAVPARTTQKEA